MTDEVTNVPTNEPEVKEVQPVVPAEDKQEQTVAQIMGEESTPDPKIEQTVPVSTFLELKKEKKELKRELEKLQAQVISGAVGANEVSDDLSELAEEFGIDKKFLSKLESALIKKSAAQVESTLKPLQAKENQEKMDSAFNTHFQKAIDKMPEFEGIANKEVIKSLSRLPENANKTFSELLEDTYGNAIVGKRTIETTSPNGGKSPDPVDFERAQRDPAYLKQINSDPVTSKEYRSLIIQKLTRGGRR